VPKISLIRIVSPSTLVLFVPINRKSSQGKEPKERDSSVFNKLPSSNSISPFPEPVPFSNCIPSLGLYAVNLYVLSVPKLGPAYAYPK